MWKVSVILVAEAALMPSSSFVQEQRCDAEHFLTNGKWLHTNITKDSLE
jgi:hypothetical protein